MESKHIFHMFHFFYNSNFWSQLQSKAFIWIYYWRALSNHSIPFQALTNIWQINKKKTSEKVKVRRPLVAAFILTPKLCEVKISAKLILVRPSTLLQRPWAPPCWNNPLQSTHSKAGPLSYPLTSSTGRCGAASFLTILLVLAWGAGTPPSC